MSRVAFRSSINRASNRASCSVLALRRNLVHIARGFAYLVIGAEMVMGSVGCGQKTDEGVVRRLNEANEQVVTLKKDKARLEAENEGLKRQLAQALADPTRFILRDPEIIELVASLRGVPPAAVGQVGDELSIGKGDLDPKTASKIVMGGAQALQQCYERALKKNAALQYQAGVHMTLGLLVAPTGKVEEVSVKPSVDNEMTECIDGAAKRWKFPKFAGQAVTIEQKIMLTPKA